jgi:serine/threonine-protein kinase
MITRDDTGKETLKLADFGLVKLMQPDGEITKGSALTEVGEIFGTPHFMSPEQVMGQTVGAPADIYSLGVILYQMLTGKTPLEGSDVRNLLIAKISQDVPPPSKTFSFINQAFDSVFSTVLARDPGDRYKSAGEFYQAFQHVVDMLESGISIPETTKITTSSATQKDTNSTVEQKPAVPQSTQSTEVSRDQIKSSSRSTILMIFGGVVLLVLIIIVLLAKQ